jgi:hypothetical protein
VVLNMAEPAPPAAPLSRKSFDLAVDIGKQLIALATGIIALTITFSKDVLGGDIGGGQKALLVIAWLLYLVSVIAGIWMLYAVAGSLSAAEDGEVTSIYSTNVKVPMGIQQVCFVVAVLLTIIFGIVTLNHPYLAKRATSPSPSP